MVHFLCGVAVILLLDSLYMLYLRHVCVLGHRTDCAKLTSSRLPQLVGLLVAALQFEDAHSAALVQAEKNNEFPTHQSRSV